MSFPRLPWSRLMTERSCLIMRSWSFMKMAKQLLFWKNWMKWGCFRKQNPCMIFCISCYADIVIWNMFLRFRPVAAGVKQWKCFFHRQKPMNRAVCMDCLDFCSIWNSWKNMKLTMEAAARNASIQSVSWQSTRARAWNFRSALYPGLPKDLTAGISTAHCSYIQIWELALSTAIIMKNSAERPSSSSGLPDSSL